MMPFLGTIVNFAVVLVAGILGSLLKKGVPERFSSAIMSAMAICVIYIGVDGMLEAAPPVSEGSFLSAGLIKVLIMILSMGLGTLIGELLDLDKQMNRLGAWVEKKLNHGGEQGSIAKGFVSCSLLFCIGAMAVNGAIFDAIGKPDTLLAKSVIDAISCFVMATSLGIGCALSAFTLLIYQGAIALVGFFASSFIPAAGLTYMSVTGSLIIILIGTNMLGMTKVKTANMVPAIFLPLALMWLFPVVL
ncbi:MAG: DUF554 domain-containing protein [Clostridia bacterium]|nr:DUF554 domain-containing protein [Clostridia bacterium]